MLCELATPRGSLFTRLDRTPPYSHRLHSSLVVHSPDRIPPSSFLAHSPGPHSSLLVHSLDHTPPSWFTPWTTLLPPGSLPGPNSCLLFHSLGRTPPSSLLVHSPVSPRLSPGSLPWGLMPPSLFTPLSLHFSLIVHSPGPPLLPTPLGHIPPSWFTPLGPHSSLLGVW